MTWPISVSGQTPGLALSAGFSLTQILIIRLKVLKKLAEGESQNEMTPKVGMTSFERRNRVSLDL